MVAWLSMRAWEFRADCRVFSLKEDFSENRKPYKSGRKGQQYCTRIPEIIVNIEMIDINNYIVFITGLEVFKIYDLICSTTAVKSPGTFSTEARHFLSAPQSHGPPSF